MVALFDRCPALRPSLHNGDLFFRQAVELVDDLVDQPVGAVDRWRSCPFDLRELAQICYNSVVVDCVPFVEDSGVSQMTNVIDKPQDILQFVKNAFGEDTGGGFDCDVLELDDGTVLVISEDAIVLYRSLEAWENPAPESTLGSIVRT